MPRPIQYGQRAKPLLPPVPTIEDRHNALREAVLDNVGRPDDLSKVDIHTLWDEDHYRVNIYRNIRNSNIMTDSYYISVVADGVISSPPMDRKYYDDILDSLIVN